MRIACLDIGGTSIKSALFVDGRFEFFSEELTEAIRGGLFVMELCKNILKKFLPFDKISISTAGQVNPKIGSIIYANENIPNYTGMMVKEIFEKEFDVPVFVENDVNCAALGEYNFSSYNKFDNILCLTYGTGIGGAIIINGSLYSGSTFSAGEFGHIITHANGEVCNCGCRGCYEMYGSTTALIKKAKEFDCNIKNGREFFEYIKNDNKDCMQILENWIDEIVYGLISLIHILNPKTIFLGGGIMCRDEIVNAVKKKVYKNIMPSYNNVEIQKAVLGNKAGLYGAYFLSL